MCTATMGSTLAYLGMAGFEISEGRLSHLLAAPMADPLGRFLRIRPLRRFGRRHRTPRFQ
jgi:hypothetical protein